MEEQGTQERKEQPTQPVKQQSDRINIRCRYCGHRFAERQNNIRNIREAVFVCEFCGKPIK